MRISKSGRYIALEDFSLERRQTDINLQVTLEDMNSYYLKKIILNEVRLPRRFSLQTQNLKRDQCMFGIFRILVVTKRFMEVLSKKGSVHYEDNTLEDTNYVSEGYTAIRENDYFLLLNVATGCFLRQETKDEESELICTSGSDFTYDCLFRFEKLSRFTSNDFIVEEEEVEMFNLTNPESLKIFSQNPPLADNMYDLVEKKQFELRKVWNASSNLTLQNEKPITSSIIVLNRVDALIEAIGDLMRKFKLTCVDFLNSFNIWGLGNRIEEGKEVGIGSLSKNGSYTFSYNVCLKDRYIRFSCLFG